MATLHEVSHDTTLQAKVELVDGRRMTALELLWEYHDRAAAFVEQQSGGEPDSDTVEVMHWWGTVLDKLGRDPMEARREVDWVAKLAVLEGYRERDALGWGDPRLKAVDLQWSDVRADRGLAHRLVATGRLEVLVDEADVRRAVDEPPNDTRAWFRGTCLRLLPRRRRGGVVGLGDLRRRRPAHPAAGADARAAQGHRGRGRRAGAQRAGCRVAAACPGRQRRPGELAPSTW